jgi:L-fucose mutarotase/ribose pyranase (RbsD/FucU family)
MDIMKLEKRGKFAGVKIHLDAKECEDILSFKHYIPLDIQTDMSNLIRNAVKKDSTILDPRTKEEIQAALAKENTKSETRLDNFDNYLAAIGWEKS